MQELIIHSFSFLNSTSKQERSVDVKYIKQEEQCFILSAISRLWVRLGLGYVAVLH